MPPRHKDILQRLADGQSLNEIAEELHLSGNYLKSEAYLMRSTLGADTNCQAVAMALRRGFIN